MSDPRFEELTDAERDCLRGLARTGEIGSAARLTGRSLGTFKTHMKSARRKLRVGTSLEAAALLASFEGRHPTWGILNRTIPAAPEISEPTEARSGGPFDYRNRDSDNEYGILTRLGWIIIAAAALAFGFAAFSGAAESVNRLLRSVG